MGTLFSAFDIARSGMQASQVQLDISGHNIANVNKEGYSRQRVELAARLPNYKPFGAIGRGVEITGIERLRETFLDTVYRQQVPSLGRADVRTTYFNRIEDIFQEPGENGLGERINVFFDAVNDFANNVEEHPVRLAAITEAENLAVTLREVEERLRLLRTNANGEVRDLVPQINSLGERIAEMNVHIRSSELSGTKANDMRDERDVLVDELARLINISTRERPDGEVDILISGDEFVRGGSSRAIEAVVDPTLDPERSDLYRLQYADNGQALTVRDGELYGALSMRDDDIVALDARMDTLAAAIIEQINRIHTQSNGLENYTGLTSSTNPTVDATTPLDAAGLPFNVTPGSFDVVVYDAADNATTTTIAVDATTTLEDLANSLNAVANFSAATAPDGRTIELGTAAPFSYVMASDTSGVLTALGVNGLFTGYDARTIDINQTIADEPLLLSSAYSTDALDTGDNTAALALADVRNTLVLETNSATINDYYESTVVNVGIDARANLDLFEVEDAFVADFERRRQEVSGVSLDEEVTLLIQYQRAFEASARIVTTTDRMLETLINMV